MESDGRDEVGWLAGWRHPMFPHSVGGKSGSRPTPRDPRNHAWSGLFQKRFRPREGGQPAADLSPATVFCGRHTWRLPYFDTVRFVAFLSRVQVVPAIASTPPAVARGAPSSHMITMAFYAGQQRQDGFSGGDCRIFTVSFKLSEGDCISAAFGLHLAATCDGFVVLDFGEYPTPHFHRSHSTA